MTSTPSPEPQPVEVDIDLDQPAEGWEARWERSLPGSVKLISRETEKVVLVGFRPPPSQWDMTV